MFKKPLSLLGMFLGPDMAINIPHVKATWWDLGMNNDTGQKVIWRHSRNYANHSKYSPQAEDRKHGFVRRKFRARAAL